MAEAGEVLKWIQTITSVASVVLPPIVKLFKGDDKGGKDSSDSSTDDDKREDDKAGPMEEIQNVAGIFRGIQQLASVFGDKTSRRKRKQQRRESRNERMKRMYAGDKARQSRAAENLANEQECVIRADDRERDEEKAELSRKLEELMNAKDRWQAKQSVEKLMLQMERVLLQIGYERRNYDQLLTKYTKELSKLSKLRRLIFNEEERLQGFVDARHDDSVMRIVLFGATGHGKSSTACRMVGDRSRDCSEGGFPVSGNVSSETQTINAVVVNASDDKVTHMCYEHNFLVIDQPGTGDTGGKEVAIKHTNRMVQYLKGIEYINCVCVVQSGMDPRLNEQTKTMLRELQDNFGKKIWPYVVLVITKVRSLHDYAGDMDRGRMFLEQTEKWISQVRDEIRTMFHQSEEDAPLPAIAIDNMFERDYTDKCRCLINEMAASNLKTPFRCDSLVSPLDTWRSDASLGDSAMRETRSDLEKCIVALNTLIKTVDSTRIQLNRKGKRIDLAVMCARVSIDPSMLCALKPDDVFNSVAMSEEMKMDMSGMDFGSGNDDSWGLVSMAAAPPAADGLSSDDEKLMVEDPSPGHKDSDEGLALYDGDFAPPLVGTPMSSLTGSTYADPEMAVLEDPLDVDPSASAIHTGADGESGDNEDELRTILQLSRFDY